MRSSRLYERDGYVKPELALDDSLTGRGVLRVQVHEAQITRVIFEGDTGRIRRRTGPHRARASSNAKPLRKDDVPRRAARIAPARRRRGHRHHAPRSRGPQCLRAGGADRFLAVDGVVRMNNRGTDQVGPAFMLGQFSANGLLGRQGKLGLMFAAATDHDEYLGGGLYFDTALGRRHARQRAAVPLAFGAQRSAGQSRR